MSRNIAPRHSVTLNENDRSLRNTVSGKLLFTKYKESPCALLIRDNRLRAASFFSHRPSRIGAIYIGKVKKIVKNLDACFVEIADKELCFLPLKKASAPYLLNRTSNGRLLEGDELLVQVERDAQKTKQACITAEVSLSNDYVVLSLGTPRLCFSSKLDKKQRDAIVHCLTKHKILSEDSLQLIQDVHPIGAIIRTRASELDESALMESFRALFADFCHLLHNADHRCCFSCIAEAPETWTTVFDSLAAPEEYQEIITDQAQLYPRILDYCSVHFPEKICRLYQEALSLSTLYSLDSRLQEAFSSHVWLKSGAYIIIQPTEALTVIDVNSGKNSIQKDAEETWSRINLEAAGEIALQLRLRNLSGIIIIDFINMSDSRHRQRLLEYMRELVKADRVKTTVVDITPLGLMEITRKKGTKPLHEQLGRIYHEAD
ncbi:MAG: ribonuclease E/G [Acetatifactor sp.]|nr:ribonuclease E/G [Acetatifactor sp.]